jgi:hypothetical protein
LLVPKKTQLDEEPSNFIWTAMALTSGRGAVSGAGRSALQAALSLEPGVAKQVPVILGGHKELQALLPDDPLAALRQSLKLHQIEREALSATAAARDALRVLAAPVEVRVILKEEGGPVRISFPEIIGKLQMLNLEAEVIVVIAGPLIEFWNIEPWRLYLDTVGARCAAALDVISSITK